MKKTPIGVKVSEQYFHTKQEASKFAIQERRRKAQMGIKTRYELDMDPGSGMHRVREFIYEE